VWSRNLGHTASGAKRTAYRDGDGSRRRLISTRSVHNTTQTRPKGADCQIQQTPDLSSLDPEHLPDDTLAALPQITKLKDALYSQEFRNLVREVTGCGPLSGKKTDGSVGLYSEG